MKAKKYGADESGKTFGPGHDGWYAVCPHLRNVVFYRRAKSAFAAAALAGFSLVEASCHPITDEQHAEFTKDEK